jgi:septal ring factor EnvC (AmiA/AmiB activator)
LTEANQDRKQLQEAVNVSNQRVAHLTEQVVTLRNALDNQHESLRDMQSDVVLLQFQAEEYKMQCQDIMRDLAC